MNTHLGACIEFQLGDVRPQEVAASKVIYLEGYLFDAPAGPETFAHAARLVGNHEVQVSLSLSDPWCAERHREALSMIRPGPVTCSPQAISNGRTNGHDALASGRIASLTAGEVKPSRISEPGPRPISRHWSRLKVCKVAALSEALHRRPARRPEQDHSPKRPSARSGTASPHQA